MTYTDFVSVMLTAISVLLTLLALIIALIAVIGWNTINRGARRQVERYLEQGFEDGRPLYLKLQALMFEGISRIDTDLGHEDDKKQEKGDQDD